MKKLYIFLFILFFTLLNSCSNLSERKVCQTLEDIMEASKKEDISFILDTAPFLRNQDNNIVIAYMQFFRNFAENQYDISFDCKKNNQYLVILKSYNEKQNENIKFVFTFMKEKNKFYITEDISIQSKFDDFKDID